LVATVQRKRAQVVPGLFHRWACKSEVDQERVARHGGDLHRGQGAKPMRRGFDGAFYIAIGMCLVGILGEALMFVLLGGGFVNPPRTPLVFWGLVALFLALFLALFFIGIVWLLVHDIASR
jgi:hypothetical protein